jgi:hypothetical protein
MSLPIGENILKNHWGDFDMRQPLRHTLWRILPSFLVVMIAIGAGAWMVAHDMPERSVIEDVHKTPELPTMPVIGDPNPSEYYLGLDRQGWVALFQGPPPEGKVIKTFYQIRIDSLESGVPSDALVRLYRGILIQDANTFGQILKQYQPYAVRPK